MVAASGVDISPFINNLPKAVHDTVLHSECQWQYFPSGKHHRGIGGARLLLVDEDTAATNFMIRDRRMQLLIAKNQSRLHRLLTRFASSILTMGYPPLVMGGSGDYFDIYGDCDGGISKRRMSLPGRGRSQTFIRASVARKAASILGRSRRASCHR